MIARTVQRALTIAACAVSLSACISSNSSISETIGLEQRAPDEFLVMSKAPLVVPPNINLRPPAPGAPPLTQSDPREVARTSITGQGASNVAASPGEQTFLSRANAGEADLNVRADLLREQGIETVDQTVADQVLQARRIEAETLDANSEARRLRDQSGSGEAQTAEAAPSSQPDGGPTSILLEDILGGN